MTLHRPLRFLALLLSLCVLPAQAQQGGLLDSLGSLFKPKEDAKPVGAATDEGAVTRNLKPVAASGGEKRVALVIGNNAYQSVSKLEKATNDARAVGRALEAAGFQIRSVIDGNRTQMNQAINQFVEDVGGGGIGVFFFAGHGVQVNNQNFLIPIDLPTVAREADIADHGISLQNLQDKIADARAKFSLLVVDACRDNPLPKKAGRSIGATRGLTQASSAEGQMVVFSAGANQQALDSLAPSDTNPNGVFTREFLPWVTKPGVTIRDAVLSVRSAVRAKARTVDHDQFPAIYDQAEGNFYFIFQGPANVTVQGAPADPEADTWRTAERANSENAYRAYLETYPQGKYATAARIALEALKPGTTKPGATTTPERPATAVPPAPTISKPAAADDPETAFWNEVKASGSKEYYDAYIKQYPKGKYLALARLEMKKIEDRDKVGKAREDAERRSAQAREEAERKRLAEQDKQERVKSEQEQWEGAKQKHTVVGYTSYLNSYPSGAYAVLARLAKEKAQREEAETARQEAIHKEQEAKAAAEREKQEAERGERERREADERAETEHWQKASVALDSATVQGYIDRYPSGRYVTEAKARIKSVSIEESSPRVSSGIDWQWPASGKLISSFVDGSSKGGIDIAANTGDQVVATAPGKVVYAGAGLKGYGKLIILRHNAEFTSAYAHNSQILVKENEMVTQGQRIGLAGSTDAESPRVHFEIRRQGKPVDPLSYLPKR
jgi:murein DD-endopeptidase MepM/ murein hydrolase activator NlpD